MASTKIINVLKDDKFEEILDLFKETSAKEVIFVLPKKSKAFTNEEHFIILAAQASKAGKKISILCSNPDVNKIAKKYKFDVLMPKGGEKSSLITAVNQHPGFKTVADEAEEREEEESEEQDNDVESEEEHEPEQDAELDEEVAEDYEEDEEEELVLPPPPVRSRGGLEGIVRKTQGTHLNVSPKKEKLVKLDVRKKSSQRSVEEIQNVWENMPGNNDDDRNLWANLGVRSNKELRPKQPLRLSFKNISKKTVVLLGIISVILLGSVIYVSTGSARVEVFPQKQPIETEIKVSASDKFSLVDQNLNKLPGQLFSIDKTVTDTFIASGEKDVAQKARGRITVYNAYGTDPQALIATTRFEKDGLVFRTLTTVTIPGTRVVNGVITPGSATVEIIADKAGQEYNISLGRFNIVAFQERNDAGRYEKIYGESTQAMTGGIVGRAKVVTASDYNQALEMLKSRLQQEIDDGLRLQTAGLKIIDSLSIAIGQPESSARADEAADSFTMSLRGSLKTIGFKEVDLGGLIKQHVEITRNLTVIPDRLQLDYGSIGFKEAENLLEFTVAINGDAYAKVDTEKIKSELAGKDEEEIKSYLRGIAGVESARVILSPFWVKRIPEKPEKTVININY